MKKILGISLCALFAVSAANAEIASKLYVDQEVGANESAIEGLTTRVNANEGNITTNTTSIGNLNTSVNTLSGKVTANEGAIAQNTTDIQTNAGKIDTLDTAIQGMSQTQTTGQYVKYVKQENGDVTAEGGSFDTSIADASESTIAPTSKAVAAYVTGKVDGLGVTALTGRVDAHDTAINTLDGRVDAHDTSITNLTTSVNDHNTRITNNANAITTLQARTTDLKALAYKDTVATADIDDNAVTSAKIANQTITNDDVAIDAAIASSKIAFEGGQAAALNSGITGALVTQIGTNETNIAKNTDDIATLQARTTDLKALAYKDTVATADIDANAVKSAQIADDAVTSAKIANQTITNDDVAIDAAIASSKIAFSTTQNTVFGSGITRDLVGDITNNKNTISAMVENAEGYEECKTSGNGCTLVLSANGRFSWEEVARATGETAQ